MSLRRAAGGPGLLALALWAWAVGPEASAGVDVTLTSLVSARPELRQGQAVTAAPLLELISLSASGLDTPWVNGARLYVSAWGELRPLELGGRGAARGDVQLAFAEGRLWSDQLRLVIGRQLVSGGAARFLHLDGIRADYQPRRWLRLTAWGGVPVNARFTYHQGDLTAGGRVAWAPSWDAELGASYAVALDRGILSRNDVGVDARWVPSRAVWVAASALYSLGEQRLAEAEVGPRFRPFNPVELAVLVRRVAPDLLIPRSSIFSVFAEPERDEVGGSVLWEVSSALALLADYHRLWIDGAPGSDAGAQVVARLGAARPTVLTGQLRLLEAPGSGYGYVRARLSASHRLSPALGLTAEVDAFYRDPPMNGVRHSAVAAASASWAFAPEWQAVLTAGAGTTPEYVARLEVMARVVYRFTAFQGDGSRR